MPGRNRDGGTEDRLMDPAGGGGGCTERAALKHMHYHMRNSQGESAVRHRQLSPALCDRLEGWEVGGRLKEEGT